MTVNSKPGGGLEYPEGFYWGVATSAYQIEGAPDEDGKEDVGAKAYRFSISWPRIFPTGTGQPNPKGLDFYNRLVDELAAAGIEPFATLHHWDLPQALQDKGGWQSRDTTKAFADYAGDMAEKLSDRVSHFFTINEFHTFVDMGYRGLEMKVGGGTVTLDVAPGLKLPPAELNHVRHHAVLAPGMAVEAIRAKGRKGTKSGPAENISIAVPLIESPEHIKAAGSDAPKFTEDDLKVIGAPVDFVGINVYRPTVYVLASDEAPRVPGDSVQRVTPEDVLVLARARPRGDVLAPRFVQSLWKAGNVYDTDRVMFLRHHLTQLQRATAEGVPIKGYFLWSMMDNFEWSAGFGNRSGVVYVDYKTQKRTPKMSASFFREVAARNAVV